MERKRGISFKIAPPQTDTMERKRGISFKIAPPKQKLWNENEEFLQIVHSRLSVESEGDERRAKLQLDDFISAWVHRQTPYIGLPIDFKSAHFILNSLRRRVKITVKHKPTEPYKSATRAPPRARRLRPGTQVRLKCSWRKLRGRNSTGGNNKKECRYKLLFASASFPSSYTAFAKLAERFNWCLQLRHFLTNSRGLHKWRRRNTVSPLSVKNSPVLPLRRNGKTLIHDLFYLDENVYPQQYRKYHGFLTLTKVNWVQFPAESLTDFHPWESCRAMTVVDGFSRGSPVSPALHSGFTAYSTRIILIGYDLPKKLSTPHYGAAVAQWLGRSLPTPAIRARYPAGTLPDSRSWESCWMMPLAGGLSRGTPASPRPCILAPLHPRVSLHIMSGDDGHLRVPAMESPPNEPGAKRRESRRAIQLTALRMELRRRQLATATALTNISSAETLQVCKTVPDLYLLTGRGSPSLISQLIFQTTITTLLAYTICLRLVHYLPTPRTILTSVVQNTHIPCAVSLLATHQGEPDSIPGRVTPGYSHLGIMPDDAAGRWVFSGIVYPALFIQTLLHTHLNRPHRLSRPRY
ncbi:hypothetical protein PR048_026391 [Dryococelus australis]|uniref:Uncharacterized protein n=1 Tax=Dryococelus australis TaxID=614101 RepID=A0ABQ9GL64_9NEOP|nr:hypothetical protein PR048_026391 [Dryococelus australis]